MADLVNSRRRLYKATYAPVIPEGPPTSRGRAMQKAAYVAALVIRPGELTRLQRGLARFPNDAGLKPALAAVENMVREGSAASAVHAAPALARVDAQSLLKLGELLGDLRREVAQEVETHVRELRRGFAESLDAPPTPPASPTVEPAPLKPPPASPVSGPGQSVVIHKLQDAGGKPVRVVEQRQTGANGGVLTVDIDADADPEAPPAAPRSLERDPVVTIEDAVQWAQKNDAPRYKALQELAQEHHEAPMAYSHVRPSLAVSHLVPKISQLASLTHTAVESFRKLLQIEPIGRLHLERLQMTPVGVERGELITSVPLAPKEVVNISHREWSSTTKEFESIVQDQFEGFSEQGVSEKTELAQSIENQSKHSSAFNFNTGVSATYSGVTMSASMGYNSNSSDEQSQKDSRNHAIEVTRKASSRVKKEHKTSFKVSSVAGTENQSVRVITNPSETDVMRVDYYHMMRKWRVDLFRYGLRMTYDIVIPSPGSDLIRKLEELKEIDEMLSQPFEFNLQVTDITRRNVQQLETQYQTVVQPLPPKYQELMAGASIQKPPDEIETYFTGTIDLNIDENYTLRSGKVYVAYYTHTGFVSTEEGGLLFNVLFDTEPEVKFARAKTPETGKLKSSLLGRSGRISIPYIHRGILVASISITYTTELRPEVYKSWQSQAWAALREGAQAVYTARQQSLHDKRSKLIASLAPFDTLTLRRMEQEEIMKGVLRWLFGPAFNLAPHDIQGILDKMDAKDPWNNDSLDPSALTMQQWKRMMEFGELIKYLQQAIEWENVLSFIYPYFWDTPRNWTLKQFLEYPDAVHRAFLRSGAARVVLTIRPGFEKSFAQLVETGAFGELPGDHPYVTIAKEIENFAKTNYPGIPPANPEDPDQESETNRAEEGRLVGTWWEYTPTSALDIALNTPYASMG